jgi:glycosyltransferase involved in cell wall biosynthesis
MPAGGVRETVAHLATEFSKFGHTVTVLSHNSNLEHARRRTLAPPRVPAGYEIVQYSLRRRKEVTWRHPERLWYRWRGPAGRDLIEFLRTWRPDIVSNHLSDPTGLGLTPECKRLGIPTVHCVYGSLGEMGAHDVEALVSAAAIVAVSGAVSRNVLEIIPAAERVAVISGGVDWDAAQAARPFERARPFILCACRIDYRNKAVDELVRAFKPVASDYPEVDLLIVGDGPDRSALERIIEETQLGKRVELLGAMRQDNLWPLYKAARLFAAPSRRNEGFPLVFLEALAAGTPVIGTNVGGVPEVIRNEQNGLIVDEGDIAGLESAMRHLLEHPDLRQRMGEQGREDVKRYAWREFAARYLEVFSACLVSKSFTRHS